MLSNGCLYFIDDQFFIDFPDDKLMRNKEVTDGKQHGRPCFVAIQDQSTDIIWFIPVSSRVEKYRELADKKIQKYGTCDTILFGNLLGRERAFLIQNMFPATEKYVSSQYMNPGSQEPVRLDGVLEAHIMRSARKVLALIRQGKKIVFADVLKIESKLIE